MYHVFTCPSELFPSLTCYEKIANTKYDLMLKYDHLIELLDKFYLHTTFSDELCAVGFDLFIFDFSKSKCGGK